MKRFIAFTAFVLILSFAGCSASDDVASTTVIPAARGGNNAAASTEITDYLPDETVTVVSTAEYSETVEYSETARHIENEVSTIQPVAEDSQVQYIRTNGTFDGSESYPSVFIIKSVKELNEYYNSNKDNFDLNEFNTACKKYDDSFFKEKTLALIVQQEPSGSYRHNVKSVENEGNDYIINIGVSRPELCTADMAQWHIIVELNGTEVNSVTPMFEE